MNHCPPPQVLAAVTNRPDATLIKCRSEPITGTTGVATGNITRLIGTAKCGTKSVPFQLIRKVVRPAATTRYVDGAHNPHHWAYWRREPIAYTSGLLPARRDLTAPRCYAVINNVLYLADVGNAPESARIAARRLGAWQANTPVPDVPWLAVHQLAERIATYNLNWQEVDANPSMADLWDRRVELLTALSRLPTVVTHGDFSAGNVLAATAMTTVVLDWATYGIGPVGMDLAHLALSACEDLIDDYHTGLDKQIDQAAAETGYRATLALIGASRVHWMLSRGIELPEGYEEFVLANAP